MRYLMSPVLLASKVRPRCRSIVSSIASSGSATPYRELVELFRTASRRLAAAGARLRHRHDSRRGLVDVPDIYFEGGSPVHWLREVAAAFSS